MNWKLIFQLSLFGLVMAFATVSWIPGKIEPGVWLIIFLICAYIVAKRNTGKFFLHGFMISIVNSILITGAHVFFFSTYIANHPEMMEMSANMPMKAHPRLMMLIMGPVFGAVFGLILGLFCFVFGKVMNKPGLKA